MRRIITWMGLAMTVCAAARGQQTTGDRIVVPERDTSHPRVVQCRVLNGTISVKTYSGKEVIVEEGQGSRARRKDTAPDGMKRIGMPSRSLEVTEEDNVITVRNHPNGNASLVITVPQDTSLRLHSLSGKIDVDGVKGEVEVHTLNGHVNLNHISGTVTADSQNGAIQVSMDQVDQSKPLAISTFNGSVDATFPPDLKANLTVKSNHGPIFSGFDVVLGGTRAVTGKNNPPDGMFQIRTDNTIRGTINGGGTELTIRAFNGTVYLRKRK